MSKSKEELIEERIKNEKEIEILEHQKQRLENRIEYLTKGDRAKRTHRLCEKGGAIESVCPETKDMTSAEFYQLAEFIFSLPAVKEYLERSMPDCHFFISTLHK